MVGMQIVQEPVHNEELEEFPRRGGLCCKVLGGRQLLMCLYI